MIESLTAAGPSCRKIGPDGKGWSCSRPMGHADRVHIACSGHDFSRQVLLVWEEPEPAPPSKILYEVK